MATDVPNQIESGSGQRAARSSAAGARERPAANRLIKQFVAPFASLKLTVFLLATTIFLVFAGSLAQVNHGIWHVVGSYFRWWVVWIDFKVFFLWNSDVGGGFWFPGGLSIGTALAVNLFSAHATRFRLQAKGSRLAIGMLIIAIGAIATAAVIHSGNNKGFQSRISDDFAAVLWDCFRAALAGIWLAATYALMSFGGRRGAAWWMLLVLAQGIGLVAGWLLVDNSARLGNENMRILWQLAKGAGAGVLLLVGCNLVFRKRGGIVLLHSGIALMMLGELLTGQRAHEGNMSLDEGQSANWVQDLREFEFAVTQTDASAKDNVTTVPSDILEANAAEGTAPGGDAPRISDRRLPFDMRVLRVFENSETVSPDRAKTETLGSRGLAKLWAAEERPVVSGASGNDEVDQPAAYIELFDKADGASIGVFLFSVLFDDQTVEVDGKSFRTALRFRRTYKPYTVTLLDVRADHYVGTGTAKNFLSRIRLVNAKTNEDREVTIWMNNPFRYAGTGETFYQSGYLETPQGERSTFQVVTNVSWMIPYVACMLVAVGLLAHFGGALIRFLNRQKVVASTSLGNESIWPIVIPALLVICGAAYVGSKTRKPASAPGAMRFDQAGELPVAYQGRVKPIDTLARNSLRILSNREYFEVDVESAEGKTHTVKHSAIEWLLDVIADTPAARDHKVFRIVNLQVLESLGLERRPGFRYSLSEMEVESGDGSTGFASSFMDAMKRIDANDEERWDADDRAFAEFGQHLRHLRMLQDSFHLPPLRRDHLIEDLKRFDRYMNSLDKFGVHAVPPERPDGEWRILPQAELAGIRARHEFPAANAFRSILTAFVRGDAAGFNLAIDDYTQLLSKREAKQRAALAANDAGDAEPGGIAHSETLSLARLDFETFFNRVAPFGIAKVFYVGAFLLACAGWLAWGKTFNRASHWLLILTFAIHTAGLAGRVYISGRPPVTDLYSSAVFVGWAGVLFGIVFETVYGLGIGSIIASVAGFLTLLISYYLGLDGDTIKVMQAVLDTNFWLATHVVCISFGYATTFVAGLFGVVYILRGVFTTSLDSAASSLLARMTYGTLCFAIFFSFVGTVLGGLWADDSWGRFWGWDTKENGALIIVLWNALVLHARWGKLVGARGLAVLAVVGNIVTSWSWFGVNALGVGLHSYGFDNSTIRWLLIFVFSQFALVGLGSMPVAWWLSSRSSTRNIAQSKAPD